MLFSLFLLWSDNLLKCTMDVQHIVRIDNSNKLPLKKCKYGSIFKKKRKKIQCFPSAQSQFKYIKSLIKKTPRFSHFQVSSSFVTFIRCDAGLPGSVTYFAKLHKNCTRLSVTFHDGFDKPVMYFIQHFLIQSAIYT